ncbi:hypothetical protein VTI28DRAFT_10168 [Corynascus sepedonium]
MATIDRAIPAVAERLRALSSQQTATNSWIERSFVELTQHVQRLEKKIDELSKASYTATIGPGSNAAVHRLELPKRGRPRVPSRRYWLYPGFVASMESQKSVFCGRKAIVDFILRKSPNAAAKQAPPNTHELSSK